MNRYTVRKFILNPYSMEQTEEWYANRLGQTGWRVIQIERSPDGGICFWAERPDSPSVTYLRGRLTPEQACQIYMIGSRRSAESVGKEFGISASMVWAIRRGRAWASVTGAQVELAAAK